MGEEDDSIADELVRMPDPNADKANQHRGKPLETLLMAKNRKLQDELTGLRVCSPPLPSVTSLTMVRAGRARGTLLHASYAGGGSGRHAFSARGADDAQRSTRERPVADRLDGRRPGWERCQHAVWTRGPAGGTQPREEGALLGSCCVTLADLLLGRVGTSSDAVHEFGGDVHPPHHHESTRSVPRSQRRTRGGKLSLLSPPSFH